MKEGCPRQLTVQVGKLRLPATVSSSKEDSLPEPRRCGVQTQVPPTSALMASRPGSLCPWAVTTAPRAPLPSSSGSPLLFLQCWVTPFREIPNRKAREVSWGAMEKEEEGVRGERHHVETEEQQQAHTCVNRIIEASPCLKRTSPSLALQNPSVQRRWM